MKHSATGFAPKETREKPSNQFKSEIKFNDDGKKNRVHPDSDAGDEVKIFGKRKPSEKERESNWSQNTKTKFGQNILQS